MKVKICGLHPARDVQLCIDLKVDLLGFIFYEKSPRNLKLENIQILKIFKLSKRLNLRAGNSLLEDSELTLRIMASISFLFLETNLRS